MKHIFAGALLAAAPAMLAVSSPALAQDGDFYKGKTVRVVVGSSAGGGYDRYGRLIARHIGKHIPGNPVVIVSNMPGAGGNIAANYVYNVAEKDGTVMGAVGAGSAMDRLIGDRGRVKFDPLKINYIGSANAEVFVCVVRSDSPIKNFEQVFEQELALGSSGGTTRDMPLLLKNALGAKIRLFSGYKGTNEMALAVERNEIQGLCGFGWTSILSQRPQWFEQKFVRVLLQQTIKTDPDLDKMGVPASLSFAKTPEQRAMLELAYAQGVFTRPFMAAPEVPAARVKILRDAFAKTLTDPQALAEAGKQRLVLSGMSGEELQAMVRRLYALDPALHEKTRAALEYK
ncbi:MAG: hypothetical protein FJX29_02290 [Alphaproteobacteria bacterium]|nr:hypothetical protein [Alphaproteobacteria bacterium]